MSHVLVLSRDHRFREHCSESLRAEGFVPHVVESEIDARSYLEDKGAVDLVILNTAANAKECRTLLDLLVKLKPRVSVILSCDYFGFWNDFSTWLADACVINTDDLRELIEKARQLTTATRDGADKDYAVDWA